MAKINRNAFRRRSFDVHLAALLHLRRTHGHRSFFDERGFVRGYATAYLQRWLASDWPAELAAGIPNLHRNHAIHGFGCAIPKPGKEDRVRQIAMAHRFLDILSILDSEDVKLYDDDHGESHDAQMAELTQVYTVVDHRGWSRGQSADDDNVIYLR